MMKKEDVISRMILGAAIQVHRELGPGLLESAYEECLAFEFQCRKIEFERQKIIPLTYRSVKVDCGFRADFLVSGIVVVELKAVDQMAPIHSAQVLTYLKLTGCRLGILLNFNAPLMRNGIKRIVLNL